MLHALNQAIAVHNLWKTRLHSAIQGGAIINEASIRVDNVRDLGRWIHSHESMQLRTIPEFVDLEFKHAQFHLAAVAVVRLVSRGETAKALRELDFGEYAKASTDVILAIETFRDKVAEVTKAY